MEMNAAANGLITMLLIFNCGKKNKQAMLALNASNLEVHSLNENRRPSPIAEKS